MRHFQNSKIKAESWLTPLLVEWVKIFISSLFFLFWWWYSACEIISRDGWICGQFWNVRTVGVTFSVGLQVVYRIWSCQRMTSDIFHLGINYDRWTPTFRSLPMSSIHSILDPLGLVDWYDSKFHGTALNFKKSLYGKYLGDRFSYLSHDQKSKVQFSKNKKSPGQH